MSYPIILVPKILISDNYKSYQIEIPKLPNTPKEKEIELRSNDIGLEFILFIVFCLFLILNNKEFNSLELGIILLLIAIVYKFISHETIATDNQKKILNAKKEFEQKKIEYNNAVKQRDFLITKKRFIEENKVESIGERHKIAIIDLLIKENEITVFKNEDSVKKGITEKQFLGLLLNKFGNRILTDYSVSDGNEEYWSYTPDFIYYDDVRHIYICIEIDEPYDLQTGKPIHFIGEDELRNSFFNENLWCVFRFAEYQIVKEPNNCILLLEELIRGLELGRKTYSRKLSIVESWSEEDAKKMASNNYREKYLDIPPVDRTKYKTKKIIVEDSFDYDDLPF